MLNESSHIFKGRIDLEYLRKSSAIFTFTFEDIFLTDNERSVNAGNMFTEISSIFKSSSFLNNKVLSLAKLLFSYEKSSGSLNSDSLKSMNDSVFGRFKNNYFERVPNIHEEPISSFIIFKFYISQKGENNSEITRVFHCKNIEEIEMIDWDSIDLKDSIVLVQSIENNLEIRPITSIPKLLVLLKEYKKSFTKDDLLYFRGHSSYNYKLLPSLFRDDTIKHEKKLIDEFLIRKSDSLPNWYSTFEKLALMQHYGLKTRLLDITTNPLVALYFACDHDEYVSGELIILKENKSKIKYLGSDKVRIASILSRLNHEDRRKILDCKEDSSPLFGNLVHLIKNEVSHFNNEIKFVDLHDIYFVKARYNGDDRISNQAGNFVIGTDEKDFESLIKEKLLTENIKLIIPSTHKGQILEELNLLNINRYYIYTSMQDTSAYLNRHISKL